MESIHQEATRRLEEIKKSKTEQNDSDDNSFIEEIDKNYSYNGDDSESMSSDNDEESNTFEESDSSNIEEYSDDYEIYSDDNNDHKYVESTDSSAVQSESESESESEIQVSSETSDSSQVSNNINIKEIPSHSPPIKHLFNDLPFYHLPNYKNTLNINESTTEIVFSLHIYVLCNNTYGDPYMVCLMEYDSIGNFYKMPTIVYDVPSSTSKEDHMKMIRNKSFEYLFPLFNLDPSVIDDNIFSHCDHAFQGYHYSSDSNKGIIGLNVDKFLSYLNEKSDAVTLSQYFNNLENINSIPKYNWVGIYEILEFKKSYTIPIEPDTIELFSNNTWMYSIVNDDNESTEIPKVLFMTDTTKEEEFYFFTHDIPDNTFKTPRYIVYPSVNSKKDGNEIFGAFQINLFREL